MKNNSNKQLKTDKNKIKIQTKSIFWDLFREI